VNNSFKNQYFFFVGFLFEAIYLYSKRAFFLSIFSRLTGKEIKDTSSSFVDPALERQLQDKREELARLSDEVKQLQSQEKTSS